MHGVSTQREERAQDTADLSSTLQYYIIMSRGGGRGGGVSTQREERAQESGHGRSFLYTAMMIQYN